MREIWQAKRGRLRYAKKFVASRHARLKRRHLKRQETVRKLEAARHAEIEKMGRKCVDSNQVFIDGLEIPVSDRVGEEGRGFRYLLHGFNPERILIAAGLVDSQRRAGSSDAAVPLAVPPLLLPRLPSATGNAAAAAPHTRRDPPRRASILAVPERLLSLRIVVKAADVERNLAHDVR